MAAPLVVLGAILDEFDGVCGMQSEGIAESQDFDAMLLARQGREQKLRLIRGWQRVEFTLGKKFSCRMAALEDTGFSVVVCDGTATTKPRRLEVVASRRVQDFKIPNAVMLERKPGSLQAFFPGSRGTRRF